MLDLSIEKGVSNLLTALPISDFGFELLKQHIWDTICLRHGWSIATLPTTFLCGSRFVKKGGSVSIRHNYVKRSHHKYVIQSLQRHINRAKINTVNGRRVRQHNYKHNKLDITAREVWERGQQALLDIRVFWPQRLPLSEQVVATLSHNEQTRKKEHTMREFCKLNMVYLRHWFLQFMEVWGWNTLCFIEIYTIYCRRNMIY